MVRIKGSIIVLVQMHFIRRKQFSETNVTSHAFQQISDLKIFPECVRGPLKTLYGGPHAAHGPVVGPPWRIDHLDFITYFDSEYNSSYGWN